jgi:hypothetical protein
MRCNKPHPLQCFLRRCYTGTLNPHFVGFRILVLRTQHMTKLTLDFTFAKYRESVESLWTLRPLFAFVLSCKSGSLYKRLVEAPHAAWGEELSTGGARLYLIPAATALPYCTFFLSEESAYIGISCTYPRLKSWLALLRSNICFE